MRAWGQRIAAAVISAALTIALLYGVSRLSHFVQSRFVDKSEVQVAIPVAPPPKPKPRQKPRPRPAKQGDKTVALPVPNLASFIQAPQLLQTNVDRDGLRREALIEDTRLDSGRNLILTEDMVDEAPVAIFKAPPQYPFEAREAAIEGFVLVRVLIDVDGRVLQVVVLEESPRNVFGDAAATAIRQWRFRPAMYKGRAVQVWATQRVTFELT